MEVKLKPLKTIYENNYSYFYCEQHYNKNSYDLRKTSTFFSF